MLRQLSRWRQAHALAASKTAKSKSLSADPGALRLDPLRRVVLQGNDHIELTAREFRLLEALVQKRGETCSKHELTQLVWGSSIPAGSEVVDGYVSRLRGKLGEEVIERVGDSGYRYPTRRP